jgi:serine/threonine-protein kinase RsbW
MPDHELSLPAESTSTRVARHWVMRVVAAAGIGGTLNQVVEVLTGELVSDAVRFCPKDRQVRVGPSIDPAGVHVAVTGPRPAAPAGTSLALVEVLSTSWGVRPVADGARTVWFEVATAS